MKTPIFTLAILTLAGAAQAASTHFELSAAFEPAVKPGGDAAVAVTFSPTDPHVHVNERPVPRLVLDPSEPVLDDRQPPAKPEAVDPETVKKIDLAKPVRFPVAVKPGAPKGEQTVSGSVVYFYCSDREGWCRRGRTTVEFRVKVP